VHNYHTDVNRGFVSVLLILKIKLKPLYVVEMHVLSMTPTVHLLNTRLPVTTILYFAEHSTCDFLLDVTYLR